MLVSELFEALALQYRYAAFEAIRRYPNAFVHFSKGIGVDGQRSPLAPKLGINPKKTHRDPPGIYFYYCRWLLNDEETSDNQYATQANHYWICNIRLSGNSLNLSTLRWSTAEALAKRNGWFETLQKYVDDKQVITRDDWVRRPTAGARFWNIMDYIANKSREHSWLTMLRGIDAVYDVGKGIITPDEPAQVIVLNPKIITVLEHGDNREIEVKNLATIFKELAKKHGGIFSYENGNPVARVVINDVPLKFWFQHGAIWRGYFKRGVWIEEQAERDPVRSTVPEYYRDHLDSLVRLTLKHEGAMPTGRVPKWSRYQIKTLLGLIVRGSSLLRYISVDADGTIRYSTGFNGWGSISFKFDFDILPNDDLVVDMSIHLRRQSPTGSIEAKGSYTAGTKIQAIAKDLLQQFDQGLDGLLRDQVIADRALFLKLTGVRLES